MWYICCIDVKAATLVFRLFQRCILNWYTLCSQILYVKCIGHGIKINFTLWAPAIPYTILYCSVFIQLYYSECITRLEDIIFEMK
jgi:hypothetical protein